MRTAMVFCAGCVFACVVVLCAAAALAQGPRVNDRLVNAIPSGLSLNNNIWRFRNQNGSQGATVLGILTPPMQEPTLESDHGTLWVFCSGPSDNLTCTLKVNIAGNPLELAQGSWSLQ